MAENVLAERTRTYLFTLLLCLWSVFLKSTAQLPSGKVLYNLYLSYGYKSTYTPHSKGTVYSHMGIRLILYIRKDKFYYQMALYIFII